MANLVVCCDGTWATPDNMTDGIPTPTNVVKLHAALDTGDTSGQPQKAYYHPGVGTEGGFKNRVFGGGVGKGLDRNIKSAYRWLAENYAEGDAIYLFGFSRGAYTVRSLGGLISVCGLLDLQKHSKGGEIPWPVIDEVFANYRAEEKDRKALKHLRFHNAQEGETGRGTTPIRFLGVWDTVGSLGIPDELGFLNLIDDAKKHAFHDTSLSSIVRTARHAVAMDEPRVTFSPTLWTSVAEETDCVEIWFPGAHSDVGGGYPQTGLSDGALQWMMEEATKAGLKFRDSAGAQVSPDHLGVLHNSIDGIYKRLTSRPRSVPCVSDTTCAGRFHASALDRQKNPPLSQSVYWRSRQLGVGEEIKVDVFALEKWNPTTVFLKKGEDYQLSASGEWLDASIKCGPAGTKDGDFQAGEVLHVVATGWGKVEKLFKRFANNQHTDFWLTRREEDMPWFALVGVIANGVSTDEHGNAAPHQTFLIGKECKVTPKADGYLYAFANDAWQMYGNNRGSVKLTIKRTS
ncbi:DUF2235 domain-containing protein [Roseibium sp. M-1]